MQGGAAIRSQALCRRSIWALGGESRAAFRQRVFGRRVQGERRQSPGHLHAAPSRIRVGNFVPHPPPESDQLSQPERIGRGVSQRLESPKDSTRCETPLPIRSGATEPRKEPRAASLLNEEGHDRAGRKAARSATSELRASALAKAKEHVANSRRSDEHYTKQQQGK